MRKTGTCDYCFGELLENRAEGGSIFDAAFNEKGDPVWVCRCCKTESKRRVCFSQKREDRKAKENSPERKALFKRLLAASNEQKT